jgi:hypothetical protein
MRGGRIRILGSFAKFHGSDFQVRLEKKGGPGTLGPRSPPSLLISKKTSFSWNAVPMDFLVF